MPKDSCDMMMQFKNPAGRVKPHLRRVVMRLIEEMELCKWDDATGDFWSRLAKALQQSNISVTWVEQLDSRLASVHATGKMSWAAAT